jgi:hypothetical protein
VPLPPEAVNAGDVYAGPGYAAVNVGTVTVMELLTVNEKVAEAVFPNESVTFTVKLAVPPALGGVPERTPPLEKLRFNAVRLLPPVRTLHVYPVPDPPDAAIVFE